MTRPFATLSILLSILLLATFAIGWWAFAVPEAEQPLKKDVFLAHFYLGLATAIIGLLVHCLIFTYFLGTGRWVKEVGIAYKLNDAEHPKTTRELKRRVFPPALYAMLICIATAAAGAGAQLQAWPKFIHATLGVLTLLINFWAFRIEFDCLATNARVLGEVLDEVDRIRLAQGLTSNAEALAEEAGMNAPRS
jgi:H+/gluconate symporter-like permease